MKVRINYPRGMRVGETYPLRVTLNAQGTEVWPEGEDIVRIAVVVNGLPLMSNRPLGSGDIWLPKDGSESYTEFEVTPKRLPREGEEVILYVTLIGPTGMQLKTFPIKDVYLHPSIDTLLDSEPDPQ